MDHIIDQWRLDENDINSLSYSEQELLIAADQLAHAFSTFRYAVTQYLDGNPDFSLADSLQLPFMTTQRQIEDKIRALFKALLFAKFNPPITELTNGRTRWTRPMLPGVFLHNVYAAADSEEETLPFTEQAAINYSRRADDLDLINYRSHALCNRGKKFPCSRKPVYWPGRERDVEVPCSSHITAEDRAELYELYRGSHSIECRCCSVKPGETCDTLNQKITGGDLPNLVSFKKISAHTHRLYDYLDSIADQSSDK